MQIMPRNTQILRCARRFSARCARAAGLAAAISSLLCACGDGPTSTQKRSVASTRSSDEAGLELLDPRDDVMGDGAVASRNGNQSAKSNADGTKPSTPGASGARASSAGSRNGRWSIILATVSGADHPAKAAAFRQQVVSQYPELRDATVRRLGQGSAIVVGRFESPGDAGAQAELKRVKAIERNGQKPFAGALLLRTASDALAGPPKPHDLRSLRAQFPNVRPLFTLQVAAWVTLGAKDLDYADMREAAEKYCAELRAKGHESWFLHDEDTETSIVTVGHFDRRAYDPKSTLFAPEVEDMMRVFPANHVNGEPVLLLVDPRNPKGKTKPQPCRLVEVPGV
jgi:hypothetical protein